MRCPTCQDEFKPSESVAMPFCSERCRSIDLGHWLDEGYRMPVVPNPEADEIADENWADKPFSKTDEQDQP